MPSAEAKGPAGGCNGWPRRRRFSHGGLPAGRGGAWRGRSPPADAALLPAGGPGAINAAVPEAPGPAIEPHRTAERSSPAVRNQAIWEKSRFFLLWQAFGPWGNVSACRLSEAAETPTAWRPAALKHTTWPPKHPKPARIVRKKGPGPFCQIGPCTIKNAVPMKGTRSLSWTTSQSDRPGQEALFAWGLPAGGGEASTGGPALPAGSRHRDKRLCATAPKRGPTPFSRSTKSLLMNLYGSLEPEKRGRTPSLSFPGTAEEQCASRVSGCSWAPSQSDRPGQEALFA